MSADQLSSLVARLEAVTSRLEAASLGGAAGSGAAQSGDALPGWVDEYDALIAGPVTDFVKTTQKIGGLVKEQGELLLQAFKNQKNFLITAAKSKKPSEGDMVKLLADTSEKLNAIMDLKEKNRRSEYFNHLSALAEGAAALGWVTVAPAPAPFVKDLGDAGMFYVNRVLKDWKEKDAVHSEWSKTMIAMWAQLQQYVKAHHTTGVVWNPKGGDAMRCKAPAGGAPAAGGPPPPPPAGGPPPPPPAGPPAAASSAPAVDASQLFAEINKGGAITSGLKKVTDDMKTHKNPKLRQGPAPFKPTVAPKPGKPTAPVAAPAAKKVASKPPLVELQGKKWAVEYLTDNISTCLEDTNNKQTVYIYKCVNSTVQVKGKVNSITLDSCKKTAVVFDNVISGVEFINCQSVKAQCMGKVPTVGIEKTDGCQVFLSKDSLDTSFISAKSSEMNVSIPNAAGEYVEYAIAEQFRTTYNGKTLCTEVNEIAA